MAWGFFMLVYVEYAFFYNFLIDGVLLRLALWAVRRKKCWLNVLFAACLGGAVALLFPFLTLPPILSFLLKIAVGCLLCLLAFGRVKNKKQWGMYALSCTFFFVFTFAFGGAIVGIFGENPKKTIVILSVAALGALSLALIEKMYEKRAISQHVYDCVLQNKDKSLCVAGFYDSGNLATHKGLPVCFLSVDVFYDLFVDELSNNLMEELAFSTVGGDKKTGVTKGEITITLSKKERLRGDVYFAPSTNMVLREYKLLLPSRIFERMDKINEK